MGNSDQMCGEGEKRWMPEILCIVCFGNKNTKTLEMGTWPWEGSRKCKQTTDFNKHPAGLFYHGVFWSTHNAILIHAYVIYIFDFFFWGEGGLQCFVC